VSRASDPPRGRSRAALARSPARPAGTTADFAWIDGRILPAGEASVSIFDRGLLYGDALFETVRVYAGTPLLWREHLRRLERSLARFAIPVPDHDLAIAASRLLAACGLADAALRLTVTRGVGEGLLPPPGIAPTAILTARAIPATLERDRERGIAVVRLPFGSGSGVASGHKSIAYLPAVAGRRLAARRGAAEAIYVEADGTIGEATTANLFLVRRGVLLTPPPAAGCLAGITRQSVVRIARRCGLDVRERVVRREDPDIADEIFLTGSIAEVVPVVRLDGRRVGDGAPGDVTRRVQELYRRFAAASVARARPIWDAICRDADPPARAQRR
jgi:branched-chain amino acid aminotransferase